MSASKFCRNFLTFSLMGAKEKRCHTTGENQHRNNDTRTQKTRGSDFNSETRINTEEKEHLDVPLVLVFFPENRSKPHSNPLLEGTVQKKTQNAQPEPRPSTAFQNADGGKEFSLNTESMVASELPPGSTLVDSVFHKEDQENPLRRTYCGEVYSTHQGVDVHITHHHDGLEDKVCDDEFECTKEKSFPCKLCNESYTSSADLFSHSKAHKEEDCRERVVCNVCKKEFSYKCNFSEHMKMHSNEKPFKCSYCERRFRVEMHGHIITHDKTSKLMLDALDIEESTVNEPVQLAATRQDIKEPNNANGKIEDSTAQEVLSTNNSTVLTEQLPDNACPVESNIPLFQLEDSQIQTKPCLPTASARLVTSDPNYELNCTSGGLFHALLNSSENVHKYKASQSKAAIVGESRASTATKTTPNNAVSKCHSTNAVKRKRISLASGVVYEDEASFPEESQCSTPTQRSSLLNNSEVPEEIPAPSTETPLTCNQCGKSCESKQRLIKHSKIHIALAPVSRHRKPRLRYLRSKFSSKLPPGSTLVSSQGVYRLKNKLFGCVYCGKVYKKKKSAGYHIRLQHEEKRYSCEICGKRFAMDCDLQKHMLVHTQEKPCTCDQCGKMFRRQSDLTRHKYTHAKVKSFVCNICNKSYRCKQYLIKHSQIHNKEDFRRFICDICNNRFPSVYSLKQHMLVHTGEKPFKCSLCDKQFRLNAELQHHMNIHSGLRKTCTVCGKTVSANGIYAHMSTHTGEKPFECSICGKRFPRKSNLEGHMRSHTGEKPFACSGCDKRFALYSNMMTHKAKCMKTSDNVA